MSGAPHETNERDLLRLLERAFAHHAGASPKIDAATLQKALGLRSPYLAGRVFSIFDRNGDGLIARDEFIAAVRELVLGDARHKLWFAFRLHDHDGDGSIDQGEMMRMISLAMAESEIAARASQPAEYLTRVLFRAADTNGDGRISFEEFVSAVQRRPELLHQMTRSEAIWITPNEELLSVLGGIDGSEAPPLSQRGHAPFVVSLLWLGVNLAIFLGSSYGPFVRGQENVLMVLGRALGRCIDFNGALILIPMMRRFLTRLRASALGRLLPVDEAVAFHRMLGHSLFGLALAHAACFTVAYTRGHTRQPLSALSFHTLLGASGLALLLVIATMWLFALDFVRRSRHFELFYFTHLLYLLWLALAVVHAPVFLFWAGVPVLGFAVEQAMRLRRRAPASRVVAARALRSAVTELEIERPRNFDFAPADYVFLRISAIARHEWHPFTLSSAPEREHLTVHVRALGNWSHALRQLAETAPDAPLTVHIDGPYGSPSGHIFQSRFAVLIGAGIGVTPFASVLESLVRRANGASRHSSRLEKAYFFWANRDQYSFEWFAALLAQLEREDRRGALEIHLCMTGARAGAAALGLELARGVMHASGRSDMITGLRTHTHVGQPDWERMLGQIAAQHRPEVVDVYFCGPPALSKKLQPLCRKLGLSFREEKF